MIFQQNTLIRLLNCAKWQERKKQLTMLSWSNQCIELWFLLHFMFLQSDLHRNEYSPKITECLNAIGKGNYTKNRSDMFDILHPYMDDAIRNAKKLEKNNQGRTPAKSSPGTQVHKLIEILKPYL